MRDEFKEARSLMKLSFTQLDQQIRSLESGCLLSQVSRDRLESNQA